MNEENWTKHLSVRQNLYPDESGYIPILIRDIPRYTSREDFPTNCIKEIQTIGYITFCQDQIILKSVPGDEGASEDTFVILCLKVLRINENIDHLDDLKTLHPKLVSIQSIFI